MRRAEKEVKDLEQLEEILRDCNTVRIGTQDAEGMFIVPVNYGYDLTEGQLTLYLHSAREGRKAAAFRRGGAVAFEMDCGHQLMTAEQACSYSCAYRSIMGSGTIRELTEPQEKYEALNAIMRHMTGRNWEIPEPAVARVSVFAIWAERWTGKRSPAN